MSKHLVGSHGSMVTFMIGETSPPPFRAGNRPTIAKLKADYFPRALR
jgi:hypothetical protein